MIVARSELDFSRVACMLDFRDARAVGPALGTGGVELLVVNFIFAVEYHRDDFPAREPEVNFEIVACVFQRHRFRHFGAEILCVVIVILK